MRTFVKSTVLFDPWHSKVEPDIRSDRSMTVALTGKSASDSRHHGGREGLPVLVQNSSRYIQAVLNYYYVNQIHNIYQHIFSNFRINDFLYRVYLAAWH
jgi:phosphatidate phosphatase APP1